jgi:hypothetical protein
MLCVTYAKCFRPRLKSAKMGRSFLVAQAFLRYNALLYMKFVRNEIISGKIVKDKPFVIRYTKT